MSQPMAACISIKEGDVIAWKADGRATSGTPCSVHGQHVVSPLQVIKESALFVQTEGSLGKKIRTMIDKPCHFILIHPKNRAAFPL